MEFPGSLESEDIGRGRQREAEGGRGSWDPPMMKATAGMLIKFSDAMYMICYKLGPV